MQHIKIEQEQFKQEITALRVEITSLTKQRDRLQIKHQRLSPLMQRLSRYVGFGAGGKLGWINFKLKFKQEQLAELVIHPNEEMNGVAKLLSLVPSSQVPPDRENSQEKMERMVRENPPDLEPHIRRVYQRLIVAEEAGKPLP